ncbi:hypothetical protein [Pseudomonas savastanoi]|uniref:hypothetical protein n=1 Tax=Pseudomonas savastanoi TaxID=29438 RepID=UPI000F3DD6DC|nr:hypothetical protein [Pseudomonas savastanoi]RMM90667.1 hypothetical protein ALQ70_200038 [Pseudomonas savastanoi pv. glycinea]
MNLNWSNTLTNKARETEIISTNEPLVLGLSNFNNNDERQAGEAAVKLVQLIQTLPKHLSREGLISFAMHIGFSYEAANLLTSGDLRLDDKLFARADMVRDERGRWALLEMNIGTEVGGMFYASLPQVTEARWL